jgi:sulfite reductase subunit B
MRRQDYRPIGHAPGQFVQVSVFGLEEAPISICSVGKDDNADFELCVRRIGKLTNALHELQVGEEVGVRGPFGKGFPIEELVEGDLLFVAGGIGLAPLRSLIQHCVVHRKDFGRLTLLYGAKRPVELLFREELQAWRRAEDFDVQLIVDAGDEQWTGPVGLITKLIPSLEFNPSRTVAVVVGPPVMYRFVIKELTDKGAVDERIFLSLERHMRCGVGKCGHCKIDDLYCCIDGPVFKLSQVANIPGAI